jgi:hypothetical protein
MYRIKRYVGYGGDNNKTRGSRDEAAKAVARYLYRLYIHSRTQT